jgi:molecular chaperone GrpE
VRGSGEQQETEQVAGAEEAGPGGAEAAPADPAARAEEYLQTLQRVTADFANFRRRTAQEQQRWGELAVAEFVRTLLPVVDNLERAVAAGGDAAALRQGVELTLRQLREVFAASGIQRMEAVGQPFDPARHEAVAGAAEGVVAEEYRSGYVLRDMVLRAPMVRVGPPAEQPAAPAQEPAGAAAGPPAGTPAEGTEEKGDGRSG